MSEVIVAQLGARMHYAVARALYRAELLEHLYTDICAVRGWPRLLSIVPASLTPSSVRRLAGRVPVGVPRSKITAFTSFGIDYARRRMAAKSFSDTTAVHLWAAEQFNKLIASRGIPRGVTVYGFNSASAYLFSRAKSAGARCILEQSSVPRVVETRLLQEICAHFPRWHDNKVLDHKGAEFAECEEREWALADKIICPSEFVRSALVACGVDESKCSVVPYGVELTGLKAPITNTRAACVSNPLRVLFVGRVGLQKGVTYLFEAMRMLERRPIQCRVVGGLGADLGEIRSLLPNNVELVGPVPRSDVYQEYANADVFCFPSLSEGSATVVYEALASGLPVVTTIESGSLVRHGIEGFIVPARDPLPIAERLSQLAEDGELRQDMAQAALRRSSVGSLVAYQERLVKSVSSL